MCEIRNDLFGLPLAFRPTTTPSSHDRLPTERDNHKSGKLWAQADPFRQDYHLTAAILHEDEGRM